MQPTSRVRRLPALACGVVLASAAAPAAYAAEAAPDGRRGVQIVMVNFNDSAHGDAAKLESTLESAYYGKSGSLTSYYNEITRGRTTLGPAGTEVVSGPLTLPMAAACDSGRIADETQKALAAKGVGASAYDHISIVFPNKKAKCEYAGLGTVGGGKTWMPDEHFSIDALVHEFGHNLGYHHHKRLRCPDGDLGAGCKEDGVSHKSVMSGGGSAAGLTAPELIHNKWLAGDEVADVTESGTYKLRPLYGEGSGVRALRIPLGGKDKIVVEMRAKAGSLDGAIQGVHAHRVSADDYTRSALIDPTPGDGKAPDADAVKAGTELTDTARKVRVKVVASGRTEATVAVGLGGGAAGPAAVPDPANAPAPASAPEVPKTPGGPAAAAPAKTVAFKAPEAPPAPESGVRPGGGEQRLAETGGDASTWPLAVVGAAALLGGAAVLATLRRRRA
ncbi:LPXTG cell wall anchor domain-containing protein [Streptomyces sp. ISL-100]|uniref:LPXTG cell wall anchor domain-containing protein n=1 Tax=Streptomyces sp. ISL-100 TaxID=2819173 RepID=UPI0025563A93|nr:LPXTG cell wall anchor domain-containing protein [Streptomyces sp. ISL-100]